jgi:hypothetical protein
MRGSPLWWPRMRGGGPVRGAMRGRAMRGPAMRRRRSGRLRGLWLRLLRLHGTLLESGARGLGLRLLTAEKRARPVPEQIALLDVAPAR